MGTGNKIKEVYEDFKIVAIEPDKMPIISQGKVISQHKIEGIGDDFVPDLVDKKVIDDIILVNDEDVKIEINLKKDGKSIVFSYADNSKGIKDELLPFVFKPYFSKDPFNDNAPDPSLGLGLFIAKTAFNSAGGKIMTVSSFGNGVKYVVTIPSVEDDGHLLESSTREFLLDRYSELYIQLCESCQLPPLK